MNVEKELSLLFHRVERTERDISNLNSEHKMTEKNLRHIETQLNQIKWILTGVVMAKVAQDSGIWALLKSVFL